MRKILTIVMALFFLSPLVMAVENPELDKVLEPITKATDLLTYLAGGLAILVGTVAALMYITSGSNPQARENAKNLGGTIVVALMFLAALPHVVTFFITGA